MKSRVIIEYLLLVVTITTTSFCFKGNSELPVKFSVGGPFGEVHGSFSGLKTDVKFDEKKLSASSIQASVDANTIKTGIDRRDKDLREETKWFNTAKYPTISFRSKSIEKTSSGYKTTGDLTLKGVTKTIEIPFTAIKSGNQSILAGQFKIRRKDYGVGEGDGIVGTEVTIDLKVSVTM